MLLAFSKSNDSPCFVKIAIFRHRKASLTGRWGMFSFTDFFRILNLRRTLLQQRSNLSAL